MEIGTDRRIELGEMVLVGQAGDTIDVTYTNDTGGVLSSHPPTRVTSSCSRMHLDMV